MRAAGFLAAIGTMLGGNIPSTARDAVLVGRGRAPKSPSSGQRMHPSLRWSRTMASVRHPVASMWRAYCADRGIPVARHMGGAGWKSWKKRARAAVAR
jgi:hypothetical protein